MKISLKPIGSIRIGNEQYLVELKEEYRPGLIHIEGFSHLQVIWWAHLTDDPETRKKIITKNLFRLAPDDVGVFASRTPERPNPLMISTIKVEHIDFEKGTITTPFIDAEDGTPLLDIKPYFPVERIRDCKTPDWCNHWPMWAEDAQHFDWKNEISFDSL